MMLESLLRGNVRCEGSPSRRGFPPMGKVIKLCQWSHCIHSPSVAEVDAADEGVELVDHHQLLVVRPQERVHVRPAVRVPEHLQGIYCIL